MMGRCYNPHNDGYHKYGGRGIRVCRRWQGWRGFLNFLDDMGHPPPDTTLDRKDNNGHYSPKNCQWSTRSEQGRNKRNNRLVRYRGKTRCVAEWAEILGVPYSILHTRLRLGWGVDRAFTQRPKLYPNGH